MSESSSDTIRVLHVDDEPSLSDMVATFLEREDDRITVRTATNTDEGLDILSTDSFDCIVSDYDMPGQTGIEFLETVREKYPNLPFILYTGKGSEEVASEAISAGVTDYLQKGSGTEQYTILANRITNAVAQTRAVQEVTRTRAYFGTILEHASDYVMVVDENAQVDYISPAVERVLGYTPHELEGVDAFDRVHPEDQSVASDAFAEVLEQPDEEQAVEYRVRHADGSWRWLEVRGRNRLDDPVIEGIIVSAREISERKAREQELRQKERRYQAIFNDPNILVGMLDTDGTVLDINETAMRYIDADVADVAGEPFWETPWFTGDETIQRKVREWVGQTAAGEYVEFEIDLSKTVADQLVVSGVFRPVRNDDGEVVSLLISTRDITERKEHEQKRQQIIDRTNDAVIEVDPEWRITLVNGRAENFSGIDESDLLGREFWDVFPDARGTHFEDEYRRAMAMREQVSSEDYYSGVEEWFDINVYPNGDGGLAFYFREITEYKERERRLEQYEKIVETMDDVAFVVDDERNVELTNESILEYVDISLDALEGQPVMRLADEYIAGEGDSVRFEQALERAFDQESTSGSPERLELTLDTDGEQVTFEYQFSPLVTDGETRAVVITMRDITERKERTRRLETLISNLPGMVYRCRNAPKWPMELVRGECEELSGYSAEELERGDVAWGKEILHPADQGRIWETVQEALDNERPFEVTYRIQTEDGATKWVWERGRVVNSGRNEETLLEGFITDITEHKEREQKLEQTNALLSTLIEALPVGVLAEDESRRVLTVNERLFELFEIPGTPEEVIGADCEQMAEEVSEIFAESERFIERINEVIAENKPTNDEELGLADGRTFERSYRPINLPDGDGNLWIYRDVTERTKRERERERTIEFLQRLYDVATDRTLDTTEKITRLLEIGPETLDLPSGYLTRIKANDVARETGIQRVIEASGDHELLQPDDSCPLSDSYCRKTIKTDRVVTIQDALAAGWGGDPAYERFNLGCYIGTTITVNGDLYGTVFFASETPREEPFTDAEQTFVRLVSQLVSYELERDHAREELKQQNDRLEEFASIVSHDLRNPLRVVEGRLELAREECDSDHLDSIDDALTRSQALIDDLLVLAREGNEVGDLESVDLGTLAKNCWHNVAIAEASIVKEAERRVKADRSRLQQLFENLYRNAIEHGGDDVTVTVGDLTEGFYIEDDGPGIPEDERDDVFDAGYSTNEGGTGFGLSIVKQIVEAHDWEIDVTEGSEGGARFEITGVEFTDE